MERMQLYFIIMLMNAYWCISAESNQIPPITIRRDAKSIICPSEVMRDNALQLLKNIVSTKLSNISTSITTKSPTDGTTNTNIPATTASTTVATTTSAISGVLLQSILFGGTGGNYFDDYNSNIAGIVGMRIHAANQIVSIQVTYRLKDGNTYTAPMRGITESTEHLITLRDVEKLIGMQGTITFNIVNTLTFHSNLNVYDLYGTVDFRQIPFTLYAATEIVAFFGRVGSRLDAIGVYYIS